MALQSLPVILTLHVLKFLWTLKSNQLHLIPKTVVPLSLISLYFWKENKNLSNRATWYWCPVLVCWGTKLHGMLMIIWSREFPSVKIPSARVKVYVRFLRYLRWEALNVLTKVQVINLIGVCFPHNWRAALRCSQLTIEVWICNAMIHLNKCLFDWDPLLWKCLNFSWQVIVMVW